MSQKKKNFSNIFSQIKSNQNRILWTLIPRKKMLILPLFAKNRVTCKLTLTEPLNKYLTYDCSKF